MLIDRKRSHLFCSTFGGECIVDVLVSGRWPPCDGPPVRPPMYLRFRLIFNVPWLLFDCHCRGYSCLFHISCSCCAFHFYLWIKWRTRARLCQCVPILIVQTLWPVVSHGISFPQLATLSSSSLSQLKMFCDPPEHHPPGARVWKWTIALLGAAKQTSIIYSNVRCISFVVHVVGWFCFFLCTSSLVGCVCYRLDERRCNCLLLWNLVALTAVFSGERCKQCQWFLNDCSPAFSAFMQAHFLITGR